MAKVQLGTLLVERGLCTPAQIDAAVAEQARTGVSLGRVLVAQGTITETDLVAALAAQVGLEFVDLHDRQVDPTAAGSVSDALARRYWRQREADEPRKRVQKLWAFLLRRGFPGDLVRTRLGKLWPRWSDALDGLEPAEEES